MAADDAAARFHRCEGAGHAFLNFMNAERHRPQAQDAWQKMLDVLGRHRQA